MQATRDCKPLDMESGVATTIAQSATKSQQSIRDSDQSRVEEDQRQYNTTIDHIRASSRHVTSAEDHR